jgi:hypothetical protein
MSQIWYRLGYSGVTSMEGNFLTGDRTLANLQLEVADKAGTPKGGTDAHSKLSKILEEVPMFRCQSQQEPRVPRDLNICQKVAKSTTPIHEEGKSVAKIVPRCNS